MASCARAGEAAGDAEEEVLRGLDDGAGEGVAEEVAIVDGAQAEVLEAIGEGVVDGVVELAGVGGDELGGGVADDAFGVAVGDGLREGVEVEGGDFFDDGGEEEAGGEAGVLRLFGDEGGGGVDGDGIELAGGGSVVEAADGFGGYADGVDVGEAVGGTLDGANDLVDVDGLERSVALADVHDGGFVALGKVGREVGESWFGFELGSDWERPWTNLLGL